MSYDPPGLDHQPSDDRLAGFGSLMPRLPAKRGPLAKLVRLPLALIALPFRALRAVVTAPARIVRSGGDS